MESSMESALKLDTPEKKKGKGCVAGLYGYVNEENFIQRLGYDLDNGRDIDQIYSIWNNTASGTVLIESILSEFTRAVEYLLRRGANIAVPFFYKCSNFYKNAVDFAADFCNWVELDEDYKKIFEMLKERSLELYSSYGLTRFHLECAIPMKYWSGFRCLARNKAKVNIAVSEESPLWPGMTPLLIAAKFQHLTLVKYLLNAGADPLVRDPDGNTPLHYLTYSDFFDERLFALDGSNPFGILRGEYHFHVARRKCPVALDIVNSDFFDETLFALDGSNPFGILRGEYHFHVACRKCPEALDIVKVYLDQGVSPDLYSEEDSKTKITGIHIAVKLGCSELLQLLLEYGADASKFNWDSTTMNLYGSIEQQIECLSTLIDAGCSCTTRATVNFIHLVDYCSTIEVKQLFLRQIRRLVILDQNLSKKIVSQNLTDLYSEIIVYSGDWKDAKYDSRCAEELASLDSLGFLQILNDEFIVKRDFMEKFRGLDFDSYPTYGGLLRLKWKQKLLRYKRKVKKMWPAIPKVQWLFQNQGNLPHLCAEMVFWELNDEELDQFMEQKENNV